MKFWDSKRFLVVYSGVVTVAFAATVLLGAQSSNRSATFDRITVHRIDVVEPDGTERLAISNRDAFSGSYLHGKEIARPDRRDSAGLLFVNDEGTEDGGLIWGGLRDGAGRPTSFGHLSFDQYDQDQTMSLGAALDADGAKRTSITISDVGPLLITPESYADGTRWKMMPHGSARAAAYAELKKKYPGGVKRGYFGRADDESVGLELSDKSGQVRARLVVRADGEPALEFLDRAGKTVRTISGAEGK
jgi:hypothetical protein